MSGSHIQQLDTDDAFIKSVFAGAINTHKDIQMCVCTPAQTHAHTHTMANTPVLKMLL